MHILIGALVVMLGVFVAVHLHVWLHPAGPLPRAKPPAPPPEPPPVVKRKPEPGRIVSSFEGVSNSTVTMDISSIMGGALM